MNYKDYQEWIKNIFVYVWLVFFYIRYLDLLVSAQKLSNSPTASLQRGNSINECSVYDTKPSDCFVLFYDIWNIVGYLMLNPFLYIKRVLFETIQFSISTQFQCQNTSSIFFLNQFSMNTQFSSIWPIHRTLSCAIIPGYSGP